MATSRAREIAEECGNHTVPSCGNCGGTGTVYFSYPEHSSNCNGECRDCPVEAQGQDRCDCFVDAQTACLEAIQQFAREMAERIRNDFPFGIGLTCEDVMQWAAKQILDAAGITEGRA